MPCPAFESLEAFLQRKLPSSEQDWVELHVEKCERCQRVLEALADDADAAARLPKRRRQPDTDEQGGPDSLARFQQRLRELGHKLKQDELREAAETETADAEPDEQLPSHVGKYRILALLGKGGMGIVYLAEDTELNRRVAIKTIRRSFLKRVDAVRRFLREARAVAAVRHPNIISIYHVDSSGSSPWFVMELLTGETLETRLRRDGKLPIAAAVRLGRQIAMALAAAHQAGLVHRDIKPENIFLEQPSLAEMPISVTDSSSGLVINHDDDIRRDKVKLLDFGLARPEGSISELSSSGIMAGTPGYMAPEQIQEHELTPKADLFSLGCVLYRMLTGTEPFGQSDSQARLSAVVQYTPSPPDELDPAIPAELSAATMQLLSKHPDNRPSGAVAVVEKLRQIERQLLSGCEAVPTGAGTASIGSGNNTTSRRTVLWWIAGVASLFLVGALILTILTNR